MWHPGTVSKTDQHGVQVLPGSLAAHHKCAIIGNTAKLGTPIGLPSLYGPCKELGQTANLCHTPTSQQYCRETNVSIDKKYYQSMRLMMIKNCFHSILQDSLFLWVSRTLQVKEPHLTKPQCWGVLSLSDHGLWAIWYSVHSFFTSSQAPLYPAMSFVHTEQSSEAEVCIVWCYDSFVNYHSTYHWEKIKVYTIHLFRCRVPSEAEVVRVISYVSVWGFKSREVLGLCKWISYKSMVFFPLNFHSEKMSACQVYICILSSVSIRLRHRRWMSWECKSVSHMYILLCTTPRGYSLVS